MALVFAAPGEVLTKMLDMHRLGQDDKTKWPDDKRFLNMLRY